MNKKHVCGIDISHLTFNAHCMGKDYKYSNDRRGFAKLCKETARTVYAMEATGNYYYRLACYLHSKGHEVYVFNPYRVSCYGKSIGFSAKTDKHDARLVYRYAMLSEAEGCRWEPPATKMLERAKAIMSLLASLRSIASASANVQHANKLVVSKGDSLLNVMPCISEAIQHQKENLEMELCGIIEKVYPDKFRNLQTIPGIAAKSAAALLVYGRGMECFESSRKLAKFVGIAPKVTQSGTSVSGSRAITKTGNPYLRGLLFMCATSAARFCPPCADLHNRLIKRGKPKMLAKVAVMHRLVKIAFGVAQSGEPFRGGITAK